MQKYFYQTRKKNNFAQKTQIYRVYFKMKLYLIMWFTP